MNTKGRRRGAGALAAALVSIIIIQLGCATRAPGAGGSGPGVHPGIIVLTAEQAADAGHAPPHGRPPGSPSTAQAATPQGKGAALLRPPVVRAYQVGRTRDPADPRLMHEAHTVYRIEEDGDWELDPLSADQAGRVAPEATPPRPPRTAQGKPGENTAAPQERPQAGTPQAR